MSGKFCCLTAADKFVGAKKAGAKQKLSWLDMLRQKSEQSKQRRKPEATPSQIAGTATPVCLLLFACSPFYISEAHLRIVSISALDFAYPVT